jgi:hypothetical protein
MVWRSGKMAVLLRSVAELADALDSKSVVAPPNKLLPLVYVRRLATNNDLITSTWRQRHDGQFRKDFCGRARAKPGVTFVMVLRARVRPLLLLSPGGTFRTVCTRAYGSKQASPCQGLSRNSPRKREAAETA